MLLPKRIRKHQASYTQGHYFVMRFDGGVKAQNSVRVTLGLDPRLIRFSVVKLGSKLEDIAGVPGKTWDLKGTPEGQTRW